jgi:hypothetical protein
MMSKSFGASMPCKFTIRDFDGNKERLEECCNRNEIFFYATKQDKAMVIARNAKLTRFLHDYYSIDEF